MLELAGVAHLLTEEQKIIKFEAGIKEDKAINYSINSKSIRDSLPENSQTFDSYYNTFSSFMNEHNNLVQGNIRRAQISRTKSKRYNQNRARIKHPSQRFAGGRGRGRGRGGMRTRPYNPYAMVRNTRNSFKPEARIYSREEYSNLTPIQRSQVHEFKLKNGWLNGRTPPPGFQINERTGEVEPTSQLVSTIRAAATSIVHHGQTQHESVSLPPSSYLVVDSINGMREVVDSVQVGSTFGRTGKRYPPSNNSSKSSVTVNGKSY